jgi:hypothetical protein
MVGWILVDSREYLKVLSEKSLGENLEICGLPLYFSLIATLLNSVNAYIWGKNQNCIKDYVIKM